ncbi:MAG TPA: hypothetical protein VN754_01375, partial [Candidatus Binataceae bacterium]|nr:hypothetical protein [Candidatus Binataceae bacterium]
MPLRRQHFRFPLGLRRRELRRFRVENGLKAGDFRSDFLRLLFLLESRQFKIGFLDVTLTLTQV